jgi:hypothetical protein
MNVKLNVVQPPFVLFLIPSNGCSSEFFDCFFDLVSYCYRVGINFRVIREYSSVVYFARNLCLKGDVRRGVNQKPFNGRLNYTHLMWLDDDIAFKPEQFHFLLNLNLDIVSGFYKMAGGKYYATVKDWDEKYFQETGRFRFLTDEDLKGRHGLMEVAYTGFGFILIKKGVFESLYYPWFRPIFYEMGNCVDFCAEDVGFCRSIQEIGYKIYIDTRIRVRHIKRTLL